MESEITKAAKAMGKKGGTAFINKYGKKGLSELGKKGAMKRWGWKPKS